MDSHPASQDTGPSTGSWLDILRGQQRDFGDRPDGFGPPTGAERRADEENYAKVVELSGELACGDCLDPSCRGCIQA